MAHRSSHAHRSKVNPNPPATRKRFGDIPVDHQTHMAANITSHSRELFAMHGRMLAKGFQVRELVAVIADPGLNNPKADTLRLGIQHIDSFLERAPLPETQANEFRAAFDAHVSAGRLPVAYVSSAGIAMLSADEKSAGAEGGVS